MKKDLNDLQNSKIIKYEGREDNGLMVDSNNETDGQYLQRRQELMAKS